MLQCVAVCCSARQSVAVCCSELVGLKIFVPLEYVCVAVCCAVLQCIAVCFARFCSMLQFFAECCSVLQSVGRSVNFLDTGACSVLQ